MRNYCAVFTVKFLGTNLNAIVLPCKLHDSAGKWRSCKSAVEESADTGGVVCKHWIELAVMLGHVTLGFKGWYCHFLEGYKGLFQSLMGLHRRLLMEYHGLFDQTLLWRHACVFVCPSSSKGINCCLRTGPVLGYFRLHSKLWGWYPYKF